MSIKVQIPRVLQPLGPGELEFEIAGDTALEILAEMKRNYPDLYRCICDETDSLRKHINLFVNNGLLRDRASLEARIQEGDILSIFQAVSGG